MVVMVEAMGSLIKVGLEVLVVLTLLVVEMVAMAVGMSEKVAEAAAAAAVLEEMAIRVIREKQVVLAQKELTIMVVVNLYLVLALGVLEVLAVTVQMVGKAMETVAVHQVAVTKLMESTPMLVKTVAPATLANPAIVARITFLD